MKKSYTALALGTMLMFAGCAEFTELDPKGENILATAEELDLLFNYTYNIDTEDVQNMCGDMVYSNVDIPSMLANPARTKRSILLSWDETGHDTELAGLTESDALYNTGFQLINRVANPALARVESVSGDENLKKRITCEGLTLRALFHYLVVQKFAKPYEPATAATTPSIPYCLETDDILETQPQRSLEYVYEHILNDLDRAIEIDALPVTAVNKFRISKATPYAVKALALLSMQDFEGAATAAQQALNINGVVNDYNKLLTAKSMFFMKPLLDRGKEGLDEDYYISLWLEIYPYATEAIEMIEDGHLFRESFSTWDNWSDGFLGAGDTKGVTNAVLNLDPNSYWNGIGPRTSHMYLILAEAALHRNDINQAMQMLDKIRVNRITPKKYQPLEGKVTDMKEAISHLKQTSHGENIFSYYNFVNKKRWTVIDGYKETLVRKINDNTYTLSPDSKMWVFPFGQDVMSINDKIKQNY